MLLVPLARVLQLDKISMAFWSCPISRLGEPCPHYKEQLFSVIMLIVSQVPTIADWLPAVTLPYPNQTLTAVRAEAAQNTVVEHIPLNVALKEKDVDFQL